MTSAVVARQESNEDYVRRQFTLALRHALRHLHEMRRLADNPLLHCSMVNARAGRGAAIEQRVQALRDLLHETVSVFSGNQRTAAYHRALCHTYLEPAPSQLLAAERAQTSFGSYRRHLANGLSELETRLWLHEQALRGAPADL